jgi:hypothetical protein
MSFDVSLIGKPITDLTPDELMQLESFMTAQKAMIDTRRKEMSDQNRTKAFAGILTAYKDAMKLLGWVKLPPVKIVPTADGTDAIVDYIVASGRKAKATTGDNAATSVGTRATPSVDSGKITINKIIEIVGELDHFEVGANKADSTKEVVKHLVNPKENDSEANHCWEITKAAGAGTGISASDIITSRHGNDVKMVFKSGEVMTVTEAVKAIRDARAAGTPTPAANTPTATPTPAPAANTPAPAPKNQAAATKVAPKDIPV